MSFDEEGFLSPEVSEFRNKIRSRHRAYFDLLENLNEFCQRTKYRLVCANSDGQRLFAGSLMIKLLNDVQAAIILLERGLASQGQSMLRVALECLIVFTKICQSHEFVEAYIKVGEQDRIKLVRAIYDNPAQMFYDVRPELTVDLIAAIKQTIGETENKRNIEQWAKDVDLSHLYDGPYRLFSQEVHSSPRATDQYFTADEIGKVTGFRWGPETENDFSAELYEAARFLIVGMSTVERLFQLNIERELKDFTVQLSKLDELTCAQTEQGEKEI